MKRAVNCGLVKADNMKQAILLLSFGTPRQPSDLLPYLTSIRRGKIPTERELKVLTARYDAIGQWDNKLLQTMGEEQKKTLKSLLAIDAMYLAYLHMPNSMEQAIESIATAGYTSIVCIVTSPFYSMVGTGAYERKLHSILRAYPLQADTACIFSAHSVPTSTVGSYEDEVMSASTQIAKMVGLNHWYQAWQSAAPYGEWLGPTIESVIEQALIDGAKRIVCIPFGFVSDHVEILYDNDIICRNIVENAGATYERLFMPNGNTLFMEAMAKAIRERINK